MIPNREQQEILNSKHQHIMVLAGAGTGKTTLLVTRLKQLIKKGTPLEKILLLTFSRRAANEMLERLDGEILPPYSGTFHATFMKLIAEDLIGYGFKHVPLLITEREQKKYYQAILKDLHIAPKLYSLFFKQLKQVKGHALTPNTLKINPNNRYEISFQQSYQHYQMFLSINQMVDFDDLLLLPLKRLTKEKEYLKGRFSHILVDEYQDLNRLQGLLLSRLVDQKCSLFAVGDDDQAIYGFRGANSDQIHYFKEIYHDPAIYHLSMNYRCSQTILQSAIRVIAHNKRRYKKQLKAHSSITTAISIKEHYEIEQEYHDIIHQLKQLPEDETVAILCRYRYQVEEIILRLNQDQSPFERLDASQEGYIDLTKLLLMIQFVLHPEHPLLKEIIPKELKDTEISIDQLLNAKTPRSMATLLKRNCSQSLNHFITQYETLEDILLYYDHYMPMSTHRLKIGTIHSAKGLEFDHLFIPQLSEQIFPTDQSDIEEERRIFYVALTRARKSIFLSFSRIVKRFGQVTYHNPSLFLKELPEIYIK